MKSIAYQCFITLYFLTLLFLSDTTKQEEEKRLLDIILNSSTYDTGIRPLGANSTDDYDGPCIVDTDVFIKSVTDLDDHKMQFSMQVTFRQYWTDNRLVYAHLLNTSESKTRISIRYLSLRNISQIWTPDLFFNNEVEAKIHDVMTPNNLIRIYPDGRISHSCRMTLTLTCPLNLLYFPFDRQVCDIKMASFSYMTDDLIFRWGKVKPVQIAAGIYLPRFNVSRFETTHFKIRTLTGVYSGLNLTLNFTREYGYYIIQFYVPCALLVMISWLSFWLAEISSDARLSLVVTDLITLALLIVAINSSLPAVSYIKAIDVYTGVCLLFVIATVFQFTFVTLAQIDEDRDRSQKQCRDNSNMNLDIKNFLFDYEMRNSLRFRGRFGAEKLESEPKAKKNCLMAKFCVCKFRSQQIDCVSKFLFPFTFIVFIILYWNFLPKY